MLGLIWAQARDGAIGRDGQMPWHLPEDLAHFRAVTGGSTVLMGRRTWDSLPEQFRPLPGRRNLVVTRDPAWGAEGAEPFPSVESALAAARTPDDAPVWVIGGGMIYRLTIGLADVLEVTEVDVEVPGADTWAPAIDADGWEQEARDPADGSWARAASGLGYRFVRYARR